MSNCQLDLAFAVDCTGSMGSYIKSATDNINLIVDQIMKAEKIEIRLALIEYRDHPPQDTTFVTRVHSFSDSVAEMKTWLSACTAHGGGDAPEAVADALNDALQLPWREKATKICVLISDAPPHGLKQCADSFPNGCPLGHDPLRITRDMAEKSIVLYVAGVEPPIVPYREFFMSLAYMTGGQYVPLVEATRLVELIVGSAREEISIDRVISFSRKDIARIVQKAKADGTDDETTAKNIQQHLSKQGVSVSRMSNDAGAASKKAEEVYANCLDMSDISSMYEKSQPTTTADKTMDYKLIENSEVTLNQAKRILQKAKKWPPEPDPVPNPTSRTIRSRRRDDETSDSHIIPCRYGSECYDKNERHRRKYSHPHDDQTSDKQIPCKYGSDCYDTSQQHRRKYSHRHNDETVDNQVSCRYGSQCHDNSEYHRNKYSHSSDETIDSKPSVRDHREKRSTKSNKKCEYGKICENYSLEHRDEYYH